MKEYLEQVGMAFRLERTRQRLTMQMLADRSKLRQETINSLEHGHECPRLITLKKVADGLGKPLSEFV